MKKTHLTLTAVLTTALLAGCQPGPEADSQSINPSANPETSAPFGAHWLTPDLLVISSAVSNESVFLHTQSPEGKLLKTKLIATAMPDWVATRFPHLSNMTVYSFDGDNVKQRLKGKNTLVLANGKKVLSEAPVQHAAVIDSIYTSGTNDADEFDQLGSLITDQGVQFSLWAPTAQQVYVTLYNQDKSPKSGPIALTEDKATGIWQVTTEQAKATDFYQYQVEVYHPRTGKFEKLVTTDPYSLSLSTNSKYSQVVDLADPSTQPEGWSQHSIPTVEAPEDLILYETHIRDFSAFDTKLSAPEYRGKYKAFSETDSYGMQHLTKLRDAGLNTVHLLPTYDLSTINEDPSQAIDLFDPMTKVCDLVEGLDVCRDSAVKQLSLQALLKSYDPSGPEAQDLMEQIRGYDNYNWGYDPYHYTVPEGSYAVNPDGISRIVEFREMVMSLHEKGFRVIMDVVYNHTFASGVAEKSVLDKIVPNYYHRYNPITGALETSTCCDNTATENVMMAKLMTDSLVVWADQYKIDGFRFDLMGHQPKDAMLKAREAVKRVDSDTYFYGEGWNFGEVANNAQFVQASQTELAGTEIGTFTDRLRDAIRGGNFQTGAMGLRHDQGIGNGLMVVPNDLQNNYLQIEEYLKSMDQVKLGLAANLIDFKFINTFGRAVNGEDVPYGGGPAGYAKDPADTVNYVSKHDNQTLWDNNQYRIKYDATTDERVRMQLLSLSYPMFGQGIPFIHMGSELLRSKSFLRDSYDYGDWFNKVDFSYQTNNYNVGLPPAQKDGDNWLVVTTVLENNEGRDMVTPEHIAFASAKFQEFIEIRMSSPLFRLRTAKQVKAHVSFLNQDTLSKRGLIVMHLSDDGVKDIDPNYESIVVVFNNDDRTQTFRADGSDYELHPVLADGVDDVVKRSEAQEEGFTVPPLTTAVFVRQ
ncbi:pullulanase-type alpha-1,6-glucosidase [Psychrosphaera ytuae]|uniref:Pullulanase-type alpha-1,6-glucosidase n=1 Tax=Psychrosphaera ytuae TaxID=2820710 RepID=A0A975DD99_9GAMM|nr:pullulanase-type alpha-1,6-glucosidase [Psychrosphaera ytuae]QTH65045.1 pullulanase-type alpha-1,6-glucosidase [Psychrosphaera ytuae]